MNAKKSSKNEKKMPVLKAGTLQDESHAEDAHPELPGTTPPAVEYRDGFDLSQLSIEDPLKEITKKSSLVENEFPLKVTISQGDLFYAEYPVIAGHFENEASCMPKNTSTKTSKAFLLTITRSEFTPGPSGAVKFFSTTIRSSRVLLSWV